jgi:hypothetical protein
MAWQWDQRSAWIMGSRGHPGRKGHLPEAAGFVREVTAQPLSVTRLSGSACTVPILDAGPVTSGFVDQVRLLAGTR